METAQSNSHCCQVVVEALKIRQKHSRVVGKLISRIPFVWLRKSFDLLLHILVSHLKSKFIGSGLVKKQNIGTWFWSDWQ